MPSVNAFHAAGECRRQVKNLTKFVENVTMSEFHHHIRNHHKKFIRISTNMPCIGSLIREIDVLTSIKYENAKRLFHSKTKARIISVNVIGLPAWHYTLNHLMHSIYCSPI